MSLGFKDISNMDGRFGHF